MRDEFKNQLSKPYNQTLINDYLHSQTMKDKASVEPVKDETGENFGDFEEGDQDEVQQKKLVDNIQTNNMNFYLMLFNLQKLIQFKIKLISNCYNKSQQNYFQKMKD